MTTIHTSRRSDNREGYLSDPLTNYSLDHIFNITFSQSYIQKIILGEYNIDLDQMYDRCEESNVSFSKALTDLSNRLFHKSNPFIKNKIFYKYVHNFGLEINTLVETLYRNLSELIDIDRFESIDDLERKSRLIQEQFRNRLFEYENNSINCSHNFDSPRFKLLRIIDDFYFNHQDTFNNILPFVTDTFNNIIKNCYRIEFEKSNLALNNFLKNNTSSSFGRFTSSSLQWNNTTSTNTYIAQNITNIPSSTYLISTPTNGTSYMDNYLTNNYPEELVLQTFKKTKPKKEVFTKNTPGVRVLNKSLKIIRKFFPKDKLNLFLKEVEVIIPGEQFDWGFKLRKRKDLITYSDYMESFSINWDLNIYIKNTDIKITRCCITFSGSPILDQVLSVYLMVKSGKEIEILKNSGFFDKNQQLFKKIIDPLLKKNKKVDYINTDNSNYTLDGSDFGQNLRRSVFLNRTVSMVEIRSSIRSWLREYFFSLGLSRDLWEYSTNLDVSFEEAIDYEAFNLFDVKVFDELVKPFKWSKDCFRFKNQILLN